MHGLWWAAKNEHEIWIKTSGLVWSLNGMNGVHETRRNQTNHHPQTKQPIRDMKERNTNMTRNSTTNSEAVKNQNIKHKCVRDILPTPLAHTAGRPPWCLDVLAPPSDRTVYLASIIYVRIWPKDDLARLSFLDLAHWLTYYRYAGIERVYLYDTHHDDTEYTLNDPHIRAGVESGFVHYVDWQHAELNNLKEDGKTRKQAHMNAVQGTAYQHVQKNFARKARWMTFTDMDEYPFRKDDTEPGFLARYILQSELGEEKQNTALKSDGCEQRQMTTQFMMPNVLCEGGRGDTTKGPMLLQQVTRMGTKPGNNLVKQIVRMDAATSHIVHHSTVRFGKTTRWTMDQVMMKHMWGGRRFGWRRIDELLDEEREKLLRETVENDFGGIAERVLQCF